MTACQGGRLTRRSVLLLVSTLGLAQVATAQRIHATVVDSARGIGVDGVLFSLIDSTGARMAGLTDDRGQVGGRIKHPGSYVVTLTRIGYRYQVFPQLVLSGRRDTTLVFRTVAEAYVLPELESRAARLDRHLSSVGFYEREKGGLGHFVEPGQIEQRATTAVTIGDLLENIPGVTLTPTGPMGRRTIRLTGMMSIRSGCAAPRIFLDGRLTTDDVDGTVDPSDVLAIEIYRRPVEVPPEYGGASSGCGVLVIWTRRGP
jgi:TonB-dependent Receptor Plug Domain